MSNLLPLRPTLLEIKILKLPVEGTDDKIVGNVVDV